MYAKHHFTYVKILKETALLLEKFLGVYKSKKAEKPQT